MIEFLCIAKAEGIFSKIYYQNIVQVAASGSSRQKVNGVFEMTKPEYPIEPSVKNHDWLSNLYYAFEGRPWISFSIKNARVKFDKLYIRAGCCYTICPAERFKYNIRGCLYTWSLQTSEDNKTWKTIHKVEKDKDFEYCNEKFYTLDRYYDARYVRIIQDDPYPGDMPGFALNKLEFFGDVIYDREDDIIDPSEDDEDITVIGHLSRARKILNI